MSRPIALSVFILAAVGLFFASCPAPDVENPPAPSYDARTFFETLNVYGASFSADENRVLVTMDETGVFNAATISIADGEVSPLTSSDTNANYAVSFFPEDDRMLFRADEGGNELDHLYVRELDGTTTDLTPGAKLKAHFGGWSDDGQRFFVLTTERDPRYFDLYVYDVDGYERQSLFVNEEGFDISALSRDGRYVALTRNRNNADNDLYLWDARVPQRQPKKITPHEGNVQHGGAEFTPDGAQLYFLSDQEGEFRKVFAYDIESGETTKVLEADWDYSFIAFSDNGRLRITGINQDARTVVEVFDLVTSEVLRFPEFPSGDITGVRVSRSGKKLAFYVAGPTSPRDLYVLELESGETRRLTRSLHRGVDESHLVDVEIVRYPSFDELEIPALLFRPHGSSSSDPVPALVWVHGGPGGQSRVGYRALTQYITNQGYAVLAVNNRGSSGYGKTFYHLDDRKHGEDDLQDCIYGRHYLESLPWVDKEKIGIIGGSYGGFMVAAALTLEPESFDVGVDIFGVTNWIRTLTSIPPHWESFRESLYAEMGDPEVDRERLERISPLRHADRIVRPLLVIQGANDPRVLKVESDELVAAARENGTPVEYLVFEDEGHGFESRENRIDAAEKIVTFLDKYLKAKGEE